MEHNSSSMTPEQGLHILETMLSRTQQKLQEDGFLYRFWGYLVFIAAGVHYAGLKFYERPEFAMVWAILMPLGGLYTWYYSSRKDQHETVRTWVDEALRTVLTSFLVSLFFSLLMGFAFAGWNVAYAFLMLAYGSWLYISGGLLRLKALKAGGIINWLTGIACFFVDGPTTLLLLAFAVLAGYIIPGHLIHQQYKREHGQK